MKKSFAVLLCSFVIAAPAFAGEDSTDHWGPGGTGPSVWESPCGLADFQEGAPVPEKCRPVHSRAEHRRVAQPAPAAPTQGSAASQAAPAKSPASPAE